MVIIPFSHYRCNIPVVESPPDIHLQTCESVANHPLPWASYGNFKMFKISTSEFGTMRMCRQFCACAYTFLSTVTKGVVHGIHKVVIQPSFGVIW